MKIVLLGAPGAGKGTQAKLICEYFNIPHISTGDIFRAQIKEKTALGIKAKEFIESGNLVPDDITVSIIKETLNQKQYNDGFLLDGFPRNIYQAKKLDLILVEKRQFIDKVFLIDVSKNIILERIAGRRFCGQCGASYHIKFNPSKYGDKCEVCGSILMHRYDDKENIVLDRLEIYNKSIQPIVSYYKQLGILQTIQGNADAKDIFYNICSFLKAV
ncbi:adenylate kinase [Clostridium sp. SYSU_GA19001]|uniref:adenylate kinase n=1 Tax=Clostridium caldaquaticum TaxID=2940653 RepID=UPI002076FB4E|nr:adenylate kinase [Clostridium caldaquaticum]MCM8710743.1 adenylate kinase [Clostridium caldaquaticum]